jgi:hypothetical protein
VSGGGHDIVYEESRAKQLARLAKSSVGAYDTTEQVAELENRHLHVVTPEATVEPYPVVVAAPVVVPAPPAQISSSTVQVAENEPVEMPKTAGNVPMIALAGLLLLGAAVTFRTIRQA